VTSEGQSIPAATKPTRIIAKRQKSHTAAVSASRLVVGKFVMFPPSTTPLCGRNNEVGGLSFHCKKLFQHRGTASALFAFANQETTGAAMLGVLILSLSIIACGALPWWPYSASARSRYQRPWDWLIDSGSTTGAEKRAIRSRRDRRGGEAREAYETRHRAPTRLPTRHPSPAKVSTRPTAAAGAGRDILVA
jgi:hypothetical protein